MNMKLLDFENGLAPGTIKGYLSNRELIDQVQEWIDAGLLFEPDAVVPSALIGWLWLTDAGREKRGLSKKIEAVTARQRELF
jgi:hypothetical protein